MTQEAPPQRRSFPPLFWLVVIFEFFERGAYYGMMSVFSVYLTDHLHFSKPDVGIIKGTIQPLLYFLPIISGALADRFGFRRTLMVAFALLGGGYLLTSQATAYTTVFLSLVVLGLGAGTFKPIISGTIARCTDASNSTLGFGIFYWSINLGAFLVPLILVPYLKNNVGWDWVILASAIGTGAMLIPTLLFYREPPAPPDAAEKPKAGLLQTLASAFEIIYSPFVLLRAFARRSGAGMVLIGALLLSLLGYGGTSFFQAREVSASLALSAARTSGQTLALKVQRNLGKPKAYAIESAPGAERAPRRVILHHPDRLASYGQQLAAELRAAGIDGITAARLDGLRREAERKVTLSVGIGGLDDRPYRVEMRGERRLHLQLASAVAFREHREQLLVRLQTEAGLAGLDATDLDDLVSRGESRPFLVLFLGLLLGFSLIILRLARLFRISAPGSRAVILLGTLAAVVGILFLLPHLSLFARVLCAIISATLLSLFAIDTEDVGRFRDHFRFLLMIFIYSGFWVLYFQMFDSVLWYVKAYVDASSLDHAVNAVLTSLGLGPSFRFDVEHVTVINAGTIILLQLLISSLVKNTRALPTMITGILLGTIGMAILAISTGIWVFMLGITIFSIGEMTAHPKFISYIGQIAPPSRVAMYMGYLFLYGVIGSSIGSVLGANLYVKFVDEMNRPRTLWLLCASIGLATVIGLLLYNRFAGRQEDAPPRPQAS